MTITQAGREVGGGRGRAEDRRRPTRGRVCDVNTERLYASRLCRRRLRDRRSRFIGRSEDLHGDCPCDGWTDRDRRTWEVDDDDDDEEDEEGELYHALRTSNNKASEVATTAALHKLILTAVLRV